MKNASTWKKSLAATLVGLWGSVLLASSSQGAATSDLAATVAQVDRARILRLADAALGLKPPAVTDHIATNSAGGPHDFFSQADYFWPNPAKSNGLPYISRDGETNPENFEYHRMAMRDMKDAVAALAAAYTCTGDDKYVSKAEELLRVFFLNEKTKVNPNLDYAQAVLGEWTGRSYGIIDTLHLAEVPVAVRVLEKSPAFDRAVDAGLKKWFAGYIHWMTTATNGIKEMTAQNNHSIAYFVQLASFAVFVADEKTVSLCRERFKNVLLPKQMAVDGSFPLELKRTKPYGYSIFQTDNVAILCVLLSVPGDDLWKFKLPDGNTPLKSTEFIYPYLVDKQKWLADGRGKDVLHWDGWPAREPCLLFAYAQTGDKNYFDLWKKLEADPSDLEVRRNIAVTQPLLWVVRPDEIPLAKESAK
jgi:hypothetical protein